MPKKQKQIKDRVKETHIEYDLNINDWQLYGDAVSGEGGFKGSYIHRFKGESKEKYERRMLLSFYLNHTAPVIDTYVGHLYKAPIVRQYEENAELNRFYAATNIQGDKDIDEFMQEAAACCLTYGVCYAVIDRTKVESEIVTKAHEKEQGIKTYAYIINPKQLTDWGIGEDGQFTWVKIREPYKTNEGDWDKDHCQKVRYRIWTRTHWFIYEEDENVPLDSNEHGLGVVPLVPMYNIMGEGNTVIGRSEISEIAKINKNIFNKSSELDELMINNAFSILAMSSKGLSIDPKTKKPVIKLSYDRVLLFDEIPPQYISPPPQAIAAYETRIQNLVNEIYKIAKIDYTSGVASSGVALAFKFEKTNQNLARKASNLEDAELKIANMVLLWSADSPENKNVDVTIEYPDDFGIVDLSGEAVKDAKVLDLAIGAEFDKVYKKRIARKHLPKATSDELKGIDDDIDAGEIPTMSGLDGFDEEINADET